MPSMAPREFALSFQGSNTWQSILTLVCQPIALAQYMLSYCQECLHAIMHVVEPVWIFSRGICFLQLDSTEGDSTQCPLPSPPPCACPSHTQTACVSQGRWALAAAAQSLNIVPQLSGTPPPPPPMARSTLSQSLNLVLIGKSVTAMNRK